MSTGEGSGGRFHGERRVKGLARAQKSARFVVRGGVPTLSREAEEALFAIAEILFEGASSETADGEVFYATAMITFDLDALSPVFRGELTPDVRETLARAADGSVRFRLRAMRLACAEIARRVPGRVLGTAGVETKIRLVDSGRLLVDVDVSMPVLDRRPQVRRGPSR